MQTPPQLGLHLAQLRLPPPAHRLAQHRIPPRPRLAAHVREAEEVEGLRFPVATASPMAVGMPAELDEACLVGMQRQSESRETLAQLAEEAFGVLVMLESDDEIIREAHDDHGRRRGRGATAPVTGCFLSLLAACRTRSMPSDGGVRR